MPTNTRTIFDPAPTARRFYRLYLDGKETRAQHVLFEETSSEAQRIAVVVEALRQSAWNYGFAGWIQGWHVNPIVVDGITVYRDAEGTFKPNRRGYREGKVYVVGDRVRLDGTFFVTVLGFVGDDLNIRVSGEEKEQTVRRHRVEHYT